MAITFSRMTKGQCWLFRTDDAPIEVCTLDLTSGAVTSDYLTERETQRVTAAALRLFDVVPAGSEREDSARAILSRIVAVSAVDDSTLTLTAPVSGGVATFTVTPDAYPSSVMVRVPWNALDGVSWAAGDILGGASGGGGGGGLVDWTEAVDAAAPNDTVPAVSLSVTNAAEDADAVVAPKRYGALLTAVPDGTAVGGDKRGLVAVDLQLLRFDALDVASGNGAVISGGRGNRATAMNATVSGGAYNYATGEASTASGGGSNSAAGDYTTVGGGAGNGASIIGATVSGGSYNYAFAGSATIGGGESNVATGSHSAVGGGVYNNANATCAVVPGGRYGTARAIVGRYSFASFAADAGSQQTGQHVTRCQTTTGTPKKLTVDGTALNSPYIANTLPANSAYFVKCLVVARDSSSAAAWEITGCARRGANFASITLVGTPTVTLVGADTGAADWDVELLADTTYGAVVVQATDNSVSPTTVDWVCTMFTTEIAL